MNVTIFSAKPYDRRFLGAANAAAGHVLTFHESRLGPETVRLAEGAGAVCAFVNDVLDRPILEALRGHGSGLVALRCAGVNNVDLEAARDLGVAVARVPAYSPHAVAEHAVAMILTLNRKTHRAYNRVREGNFALDGLLGFDLVGKTVGIVGTGKIGVCVARIMAGFGCTILGADPHPSEDFLAAGGQMVPFDELLARADIITLHCPLTPATHHMIDGAALRRMKRGAMLINTSRGAIVDTSAAIRALKDGRIGHLGLDVYEEEADLFFEDLSQDMIQDDVFARLLTFPNVLVTGHQAFFTEEALTAIAETTLANINDFERTGRPRHPVSVEMLA